MNKILNLSRTLLYISERIKMLWVDFSSMKNIKFAKRNSLNYTLLENIYSFINKYSGLGIEKIRLEKQIRSLIE